MRNEPTERTASFDVRPIKSEVDLSNKRRHPFHNCVSEVQHNTRMIRHNPETTTNIFAYNQVSKSPKVLRIEVGFADDHDDGVDFRLDFVERRFASENSERPNQFAWGHMEQDCLQGATLVSVVFL